MPRFGRALVVLSFSILQSPFPVARNIVTDTKFFDITQLKSPKSSTELSVGVVHASAIKNGSVKQLHVGNYILCLYVKSTDLILARQLFDEIPEKDVRSWTILISGFSRIGSHKLALDLFTQMQKQGIIPNQFTFSSVLKCCASENEIRVARAIHGWILRNGVSLDMALKNSLLDFYVKCEAFDCARRLYELMGAKDIVSWNIMIGAYLQKGDMENAKGFFMQLPVKDAAGWNTIIDGHLQNGCASIALELLYQMVENGPPFTHVTFSIALVLASALNNVQLGKQIHGLLLRIEKFDDTFIKNSLIDMYCKCGLLEKARLIFLNLPRKHSFGESLADSVSFSSMVSGFIQNGRMDDALKVFSFMVNERGKVDEFTLTSVLSACANAGLLELGQLIHGYILKTGQEPDAFVSSSMIDMYAKCGKLQCVWSIFEEAKIRNVVLWTATISSYASHGQGKEAIRLFEFMQIDGVIPNEVTFLGVLSACSHTGLFDEGCKYFSLMKDVYAIKPEVEHYTCMVDLLGRGGRLDDIKDFIFKNNISHLSAVWRSFLSSCHIHKNVEMARWVSHKLYNLEPSAAGPYVLLSKTFASDCRWEEAATLKATMQERGIRKQPGQSWIQ